MGLFGKKAQTPAPAPEPVPEPVKPAVKTRVEYDTVRVNLSDKMLRVELTEDSAFIRRGVVRCDGDKVYVVSESRILIAEVTKKSKVYTELEPYAGRAAEDISIEFKTGDYGPYYRVKMKFQYIAVG